MAKGKKKAKKAACPGHRGRYKAGKKKGRCKPEIKKHSCKCYDIPSCQSYVVRMTKGGRRLSAFARQKAEAKASREAAKMMRRAAPSSSFTKKHGETVPHAMLGPYGRY